MALKGRCLCIRVAVKALGLNHKSHKLCVLGLDL